MYLMDIVDEMMRIENLHKELIKDLPKNHYGRYLDMLKIAESEAMCNITDSDTDTETRSNFLCLKNK